VRDGERDWELERGDLKERGDGERSGMERRAERERERDPEREREGERECEGIAECLWWWWSRRCPCRGAAWSSELGSVCTCHASPMTRRPLTQPKAGVFVFITRVCAGTWSMGKYTLAACSFHYAAAWRQQVGEEEQDWGCRQGCRDIF
jgi:hypothetical protein